MTAHLRILDTDGSVDADALTSVAPWASITRVDLRDLGPALRLWSRRKNIDRARARIAAADAPRPSITFLGSGDFHHLAALLIERVAKPFTVLHFDNHPDWVRLAPRWHCGSWVNRVLALPEVRRVVTVGPCSDDLVNPGRKGGNLAALDSGRLALFPWQQNLHGCAGGSPTGPGMRGGMAASCGETSAKGNWRIVSPWCWTRSRPRRSGSPSTRMCCPSTRP